MRLIDADALSEEIAETTTFIMDSVLFQKMVDEAPTVSVGRPMGEWTNEEGKPITDKFSVYCSKCKNWSEYRTNYCGHCGARMSKGGDSE